MSFGERMEAFWFMLQKSCDDERFELAFPKISSRRAYHVDSMTEKEVH